MEILFILCLLSFLFGALNGSYFKIVAFDDNKILQHNAFRFFYTISVFVSLFIIGLYFFFHAEAWVVQLALYHAVCISCCFLFYSASYFASHALCAANVDNKKNNY